MKYKIVVDSSSNLKSDYIKDENIGFEVAPLSIRIGDKIFIDDDDIDVNEMLSCLNSSKAKATSSCPSPYDYAKCYQDAENIIVITISSKLSGSYNSAVSSKLEYENKNIHIVDSKLAGGGLELIVDEAYRLMKEDLSFDEIVDRLEKYRDSLQLLFVLNKYDNLVKNGRVSKVVALIAKTLIIKPLCYANDGEIEIKEKVRTIRGVLKRLIINIGLMMEETEGKTCIITHTDSLLAAEFLKAEILQKYKFKEVRIRDNKGLCSFYALERGIIVSFG